jgi:hypothetical protein
LVAGSQLPNFTAHFMQNLEGRIDERREDVRIIRDRWDRFGLNQRDAIADCERKDVGIDKEYCGDAIRVVNRFDILTALQNRLRSAGDFERPVILARAIGTEPLVREIAENATVEFQPAIPTTPVGFVYGGGVGILFWALGRILFAILGAPFRPRYAD